MTPRLFILSLCGTLLIATSAYAAGPGKGPRAACRDDAKTYCSDVQPGGGRILDCLQDHYKDLSDDCYNALQKLSKKTDAEKSDDAEQDSGNDNGQ